MTPDAIKEARQALGLSQSGLAERLRLGTNGERTVRRWEKGDVPITGPAAVAIELMLERVDQIAFIRDPEHPERLPTAYRT